MLSSAGLEGLCEPDSSGYEVLGVPRVGGTVKPALPYAARREVVWAEGQIEAGQGLEVLIGEGGSQVG